MSTIESATPESILAILEDMKEKISDACDGLLKIIELEGWAVLGFENINDMLLAHGFDQLFQSYKLRADVRRKVIEAMPENISNNQAAIAVGTSEGTVRNDRKATGKKSTVTSGRKSKSEDQKLREIAAKIREEDAKRVAALPSLPIESVVTVEATDHECEPCSRDHVDGEYFTREQMKMLCNKAFEQGYEQGKENENYLLRRKLRSVGYDLDVLLEAVDADVLFE